MKKVINLFVIIIIFTACKKEEKKPIITNQTNFDFILGNWIRTNDKEGSKTYEYWAKSKDNLYIGLGYTLKGNDTVFKENMELSKEKLTVYGVHEKPISFKMASHSKNGFVVENAMNEFPKIIKYQLKGNFLIAEVSADSIKIPFKFKRLK